MVNVGLLRYFPGMDELEKALQKGVKAKEPVGVGIDPQSMLDDITLLEVSYDPDRPEDRDSYVLANLKASLLRVLGRVPSTESREGGEDDDGNN